MITPKITLVNSNPHSPNARRLGNGRGGRVISRDHYNVYDSEPPFPFSYQLWIIDDLQTQEQHINVSSNARDKFYCQACDANHCAHIRAVVVHEEDRKKEAAEQAKELALTAHVVKAKEFIEDLLMRFAYRNTREQHLQHLRVYASRFKVDFIELARKYEKYL